MTSLSRPAPTEAAPLAARRTIAGLDAATWAALILLASAALLYTLNLGGTLLTDDEESYLYQAWRVSLGELPYRDFLTPQLPGFLSLGGLALRLAGPGFLAARLLSIAMTLLAGGFVYRIGRRLYRPWVGVGALALFLAYPRVVDMARLYRPESFMLAMQAAGLYAFIAAYEGRRRRGLAGAGVLLGLAMLMKLFGALTLLGVLAFLAYEGVRGFRPWRTVLGDGLAVAGSAAAVVLGVLGVFMLITPQTYTAILGHHLMQGSGLGLGQTLGKGVAFLLDYYNEYTTVLILASAGALLTLRDRTPRAILAWQLPTALAFLFLTRELFLRHTVYLAPVVCLLAAGLFDPLLDPARAPRWGRLIVAVVLAAVIAPWIQDSIGDHSAVDTTTWRVVAYLDAAIPLGAPVVADNPGLNFYTRRATTPSAASLSEGATGSGQITAARLVTEMDQIGVNWIMRQAAGPGKTLGRLVDEDIFRDYLATHFEAVGSLAREDQTYTLFRRRVATAAPAAFPVGPLRVTPLSLPAAAQPGQNVSVTLALQPQAKPDPAWQASVILANAGGQPVATTAIDLDTFGSTPVKSWQPDALVVGRVDLSLPATLAPGEHTLLLEVLGAGDQPLGQATLGRVPVAGP